jgi:hypothetical protein
LSSLEKVFFLGNGQSPMQAKHQVLDVSVIPIKHLLEQQQQHTTF